MKIIEVINIISFLSIQQPYSPNSTIQDLPNPHRMGFEAKASSFFSSLRLQRKREILPL